jgi:hypothetical protein
VFTLNIINSCLSTKGQTIAICAKVTFFYRIFYSIPNSLYYYRSQKWVGAILSHPRMISPPPGQTLATRTHETQGVAACWRDLFDPQIFLESPPSIIPISHTFAVKPQSSWQPGGKRRV